MQLKIITQKVGASNSHRLYNLRIKQLLQKTAKLTSTISILNSRNLNRMNKNLLSSYKQLKDEIAHNSKMLLQRIIHKILLTALSINVRMIMVSIGNNYTTLPLLL